MDASPLFHLAERSLDAASSRPLHPLQWFAQRGVPPWINARRTDSDRWVAARSPRGTTRRGCRDRRQPVRPGAGPPCVQQPLGGRSLRPPRHPMEASVYHQNFNPTGHLWLSALLAALPLLALLGLLGGLRWR